MNGVEWKTRFSRYEPDPLIFSTPADASALPASDGQTAGVLESTLAAEDRRMEWISNSVANAWKDVEDLILANKQRCNVLQADLPGALEEDYKQVPTPWDDSRFRLHFQLTSLVDESDTEDVDIASRDDAIPLSSLADQIVPVDKCTGLIKIKKEKLGKQRVTRESDRGCFTAQPPSSSRSTSPTRTQHVRSEVVAREGRASNLYIPDKYLLSTSRYPDSHAPLRRCFSHILQRRDQLPPTMHKLLSYMQDAQQALSRIEEQMGACVFHLPLHRPFQCIALLIIRELSKPPVGAALSKAFEGENRPIFDALLAALRTVLEAHKNLEEIQRERAGVTREKADLGAQLWGVLSSELDARKELHTRTVDLIEQAIAAEQQHSTGLQKVVDLCVGQSNQLFEEMLLEAAAVTATVKRLIATLDTIIERGRECYTSDTVRLDTLTNEASYRLDQSRKEQDKILRRIREQYKALQKEQQRHHEAYCDVLAAAVHKKRLDHTYESFSAAAQYRMGKLKEALDGCDFMHTTIADAKTVSEDLFTGVRQHVERERNTEKVRKCSAAVLACQNALEWRRVLGDIACLYTKQSEDVEQRHDSWQLDYLLTHQRKSTTDALRVVREDTADMDGKWKVLRDQYLEPFDVAFPDVLSEVDERKEVRTSRFIMVELETARKVLRSKPELPIKWCTLLKDPDAAKTRLDNFVRSILPANSNNTNAAASTTATEAAAQVTSPTHPAAPQLRDPQLSLKVAVPAVQKLEKELERLHAESQAKKAAKAAGAKLPIHQLVPVQPDTPTSSKDGEVSKLTTISIRTQLDVLRAQRRELDGSDAEEIDADEHGFVPLSPVKRKEAFSPVVTLPSATVVPLPNPAFVRKTLREGVEASRNMSPNRVPRPPLRE